MINVRVLIPSMVFGATDPDVIISGVSVDGCLGPGCSHTKESGRRGGPARVMKEGSPLWSSGVPWKHSEGNVFTKDGVAAARCG